MQATFFHLLVSDDALELEHHDERGDQEVHIGRWENFTRESKFRTKLTGPIGPASAIVQQRQVYDLHPEKLVVDSTFNLVGAPYRQFDML